MDNIAMATEDKAKEKDQLANRCTTKDPTTMRKEKTKDKERQPAKEEDTQQAATDVVNRATQQRTAEFLYTAYRRIPRKGTMMQQISGMDHKPPMTTIGGQTTKHKFMQSNNNHNNWHCLHRHN